MTEESLTFHDYPIILSVGSEIETQAANEAKNQTCVVCRFWIGRCLRNRIGKLASSDACEIFQRRE